VEKNRTGVWVEVTNRLVTASSSLVAMPARPLPPRLLGAEGVERRALDVAPMVTVTTMSSRSIRSSSSIPSAGGDLGDARRGETWRRSRRTRRACITRRACAVAEDLEQLGDRGGELAQLAADLVAAERGEAVEAQLEDGADLRVGEAVGASPFRLMLDRFDQRDVGRDLGDRPFAREQGGARFGGRGGAADDADHLVEVGDRDDEAEQDVRALARLGELELGAAGDHLLAELDERLDDVARFSVSGRPPRIASMLAGKLACAGVWRQSWFSTTSGVASRFSSMTTRTPSRFDSSRMSETPSMRLSLAASAIFSTRPFLPTW
jgi:hypothetical protein